MKRRAPALPDSATFQQLWDTLGSELIKTAQEHLLYTQEVTGSSPVPPTILYGRLNSYFASPLLPVSVYSVSYII